MYTNKIDMFYTTGKKATIELINQIKLLIQ